MSYYYGNTHNFTSRSDENITIKTGRNESLTLDVGTSANDDFQISGGHAWNYFDIPIVVRSTGANFPALEPVTGLGNIELYSFPHTKMCEVFGTLVMPHSYKVGKGVYIVLRLTSSAGLPITGNYNFYIQYSWSNPNSQMSAMAVTSVTGTFTQTWEHKIAEISTPILTGSLEAGAVICFRIYREPADVVDSFENTVYLMSLGAVFKISKFGTANRTPPLYT